VTGTPRTAQDGATQDDWLHFDLVLGLGAHLLPVVHDSTAKPTAGSAVKEFGKIPSEYTPSGEVHGIKNWPKRVIPSADIDRWSRDGRYSVCVRCEVVRALDCDITDPLLAKRIADFISHRRALPKRMRSNSPKFLHAFRLPGVFKKRVLTTAGGNIEFLANGQQFVAAGRHPSGALYEWQDGLPLEIPALTVEEFEDLWSALEIEFGTEPAPTDISTKCATSAQERGSEVLTTITEEQQRDVKSALSHPALLKAAGEETICSEVGYALLSLGVTGRERWLKFCAGAEDHSDTPDANWPQEWWERHQRQSTRSDFRHIFRMAQERGWQNRLASRVASTDECPKGSESTVQNEPAVARRFAPIPAHEFAEGEPLEYFVDGVLPKAALGVVFGASGSGKTFWIFDLGFAVARGQPWRGRQVKYGRIVYICAEGAAGCRKRLRAYAQQNDVRLGEIPFDVIPDSPNLIEKEDVQDLIKAIQQGGEVALVVVDTLAATSPGANENSSEDMGQVLGHCREINRATGALVILVHHSGKDETKGARGWSGLRAAADVEVEITRGDGANRKARITKLKDGEDGAIFPFRLVPLSLDRGGKQMTSCVVEHVEAQASMGKPMRLGDIEKHALDEIREVMALGSGSGLLFEDAIAKTVDGMVYDPNKEDRRRETARRAIQRLATKGYLWIENNMLFMPDKALASVV
jgi:hypothetical protein